MTFVWVTRRFHASCAHRLWNGEKSVEENEYFYGKCTQLHGHNYIIEVSWCGPIDAYGMVIDIGFAKLTVQSRVIEKIDHKCLDDIEYFKTRPSTTENLCMFIHDSLKDVDYESAKLASIKVWETENNVFELRLL